MAVLAWLDPRAAGPVLGRRRHLSPCYRLRVRSTWLGWLLGGLGLYAGLCLLVLAFQRRLLYFPERAGEAASSARAARLGLEPWRDGAGRLRGWRAPGPSRPVARLLVLHGNAGSALDRVYYPEALGRLGLEVSILEYPGYGARPGSPSEASLVAVALDAVDALASAGEAPVWLLGESLGSGVAARAASLRPRAVRGLFLVTPFASLPELARHHYPFLPGFLLRDRFEPTRDLASFGGPVAILVAGRDEVVTAAQGRKLFQALPGPKRLWEQPGAQHNTLDLRPDGPLWREVTDFLAGR
jgi:pimeloyl-ACP methyl ester carboxylesterase